MTEENRRHHHHHRHLHLFHLEKEEESRHEHKKEEKKHKHRQLLGELGGVAASIYAMHEKHKAKKDPEHALKHKMKEEVATPVAVGLEGYAFHNKKEDDEETRNILTRISTYIKL